MKRLLIFAGTTEGRVLMERIRPFPVEVFVSVATEYGKELLLKEAKEEPSGTKHKILSGRMNREEIRQLIRTEKIDLVVDATHPFAVVVTENIKEACAETDVPYLRLLRAQTEKEEGVVYVPSVKEGVKWLGRTKGNILITTGSKELEAYTELPAYKERCYARVLSTQAAVQESVRVGLEGEHLIAMQGPYSEEMNIALIHHVQADYLITKESGSAGGFEEKVRAAAKTGTVLVVVERPKEAGKTLEEVLERIRLCSLQ